MSLMSHSIRPQPKTDSLEEIFQKLAEHNQIRWAEYAEAFFTQRKVMEKEIGFYMPVKGHRVLLKAIVLPEKTTGGIILTDTARDSNTLYDIGMVIGLGPEAYTDRERFPNGPRCKIGDWVDFTPFEKQKKNYNDHLCYVINDDRVNFPILDITMAVKELRPYAAVKA